MKERLTGAIILVALIVLVVPELLTGPLGSKPAGTANRAAGAPALSAADAPSSKTRPPVRSYTLALSPSAPASGIGKRARAESEPKPSPQGVASPTSVPNRAPLRNSPSNAPRRTAAQTVPTPKPKPVSHGASHSREPALARRPSPPRAAGTSVRHKRKAAGRWVVQLASFSRHANALRLARRLRRKHFPVAIAPLRLRDRLWWRVWVGPVRGRAAAQRLARQLRPAGLHAEVLRE